MDIEEELAELKAELDNLNEDPKLIRYVNSKEYRMVLKKQQSKICEICGKEFKITHLCETDWSFNWSDFQNHFASSKTLKSSQKEVVKTSPNIMKTIEPLKRPTLPYPEPSKKKKNSSCGTCFCLLVVVVILIIFL